MHRRLFRLTGILEIQHQLNLSLMQQKSRHELKNEEPRIVHVSVQIFTEFHVTPRGAQMSRETLCGVFEHVDHNSEIVFDGVVRTFSRNGVGQNKFLT